VVEPCRARFGWLELAGHNLLPIYNVRTKFCCFKKSKRKKNKIKGNDKIKKGYTYRRKFVVSQKGCEQVVHGNLVAKRGFLAFKYKVGYIFQPSARPGQKLKSSWPTWALENSKLLGGMYIHTGKFLVRIDLGMFCSSINC
jgi:hypothetical protein